MSGYTFIDNSELSVCEKIKQYFKKNPSSCMDSSSSSSSSNDRSIDFDASFQKKLNTIRNQSNVPVVRRRQYDETIDLCSPPACMSPASVPTAIETSVRSDNKRESINLISFDDSCEVLRPLPNIIEKQPQINFIEDDSINTSNTNDSWCKISDETFERHEAECVADDNDNDETQIFDVEAPSTLWDESAYPMEESLPKWKSVVGSRRLPSTIPEESTINSETSQESTQPGAPTTNAPSNSVLLEPSNSCIPKTKTYSAQESKFLESKDLPSHKKLKYRPSMINLLPENKKKRNYYFPESTESPLQTKTTTSVSVHKMSLIGKSHTISKGHSFSEKESRLTSPVQKNTRKSPAQKFELYTCPENNASTSSFDDNEHTSSNQLSETVPHFNDTMEEVEFLIEKGKTLEEQRIKERSRTPSPITALQSTHQTVSTPKSKNKTDVRRYLLMRNFTNSRNEPERIKDLQLMQRRSVNKSSDDSFCD